MSGACILLAFLLSAVLRGARSTTTVPKFPGLPTITELVEGAGYSCTNMLVTTEDGYALWLHRLGNNTGPPVLLQHGFLNAADIWLTNGRDKDLVYMLLDEGYDVYLSNFRGTVYNPHHTKYKRTDKRFWNYSFHESGLYDLPAMIDKVLELRSTDKLFYIGHSLGTTIFMIMASLRPEYNEKIKAALLLSPVAYFPESDEFPNPFIRLLNQNRNSVRMFLERSRFYEVLPRTAKTIRTIRDFCSYKSPTQDYCIDFFMNYVGEHRANLDRKTFGYHMSFHMTGTSIKSLLHLSQLFKTGRFDSFDYGPKDNQRVYNSSKPPTYPVERVTSPVALFWSYNDNVSTETSVTKLAVRLPNVIYNKPNIDPKFSHADPFIGLNAKETLYDKMIDLMAKYR